MTAEAGNTGGAPAAPPVNLGQQLDQCAKDIAECSITKTKAFQAWKLAEARERMKLRTTDEVNGERWADRDITAKLTVNRNDPDHEIGKLWIAYTAVRARLLKLEANHEILERANWDAINRGRFGI